MTPDQLKAYHARMAELKSKIDFSTQQQTGHIDNDYHKKSFIDADGDQEELYNYDEYDRSTGYYKKPPGYGMGYSHPRHLNNLYNTKIKNFKDMDRVIDENELLRVIDSCQLTSRHKVATPANWKQGEDVIIVPAVDNDAARELFPEGWETVKPYLRKVKDPSS